jgi:hypothetical protein
VADLCQCRRRPSIVSAALPRGLTRIRE